MSAMVAAAPARAVSDPPACHNGATASDGEWTAIAQPTFPNGNTSRDRDSYAVDPTDPSNLLISDGTTVLSSGDGGCTWRMSLDERTAATLAGLSQYRQIWAL